MQIKASLIYITLLLSLGLLYSCNTSTDADTEDDNSVAPEITSINPEYGPTGILISLQGNGFIPSNSDNKVTFNGDETGKVLNASPSELFVLVPEDAESGPISVNVNGQETQSSFFKVVPPRKIAFSIAEPTEDIAGYEIWIARTDGSEMEKLIGDLHDITTSQLKCSPDGTQILFVRQSDNVYASEIWVIGANGSNPTKLITIENEPYPYPEWSPDGTKIAFGSDGSIWVMEADGSNPINLSNLSNSLGAGNLFGPDWSPDGKKIVFFFKENIWSIEADGSNLTQLTNNGGSWPRWSPDGSKIAFDSQRTGNSDIWVMDADGSNLKNVTNDPIQEFAPQWSPDGSKIIFESGGSSEFSIWIIDVDGSNRKELTIDGGLIPQVSPDGTQIVYKSWTDISVMGPDASTGGIYYQKVTNFSDSNVFIENIQWCTNSN